MSASPPVPHIRVGLALGGGVVRGLAHIGVLSVLLQAGVTVDYVSGSSVGSLVGALLAAGIPLSEIISLSQRLRWYHFLSPDWPWRGLLSIARMESWLVKMLGDLTFADLELPLAVVTTDLENGEPYAIQEGRLAPAVRASCSVPGFISPVKLNGRILGDGSLVDTIPVNVLREMGADYVIGVDIMRTKLHRAWGFLGYGYSALETLVRHAGGGLAQADCLISPDLGGSSYLNFSRGPDLIARGERAARELSPQICSALGLE